MKKSILIIGCILFVLWGGVRIYKEIVFEQNCEGYLKRAADANTVEMAKKQLAISISYLEDNNLTSGYTSIIYRTPDEDIKFWYLNLKASLKELASIKEDATQLEKTNVLMKLRETLLDNGEKGTKITCPDGISIYPSNMGYMIFAVMAFIIMIIGVVLLLQDYF